MKERKLSETLAQDAATRAYEEVKNCIRERKHFRVEAGAGAGKTFTLVQILQFLIRENRRSFIQRDQRIACISYTNAAVNEIIDRTHNNPIVLSSTIHSFCWALIHQFQPILWESLKNHDKWEELITEAELDHRIQIVYEKGYRFIDDDIRFLSLHHDDVIFLIKSLLVQKKFRNLLASKFPFILIDEYQDMDKDFAAALVENLFDEKSGPIIGLFGDSWQKIYNDGCGLIHAPRIKEIKKNSNFRSDNIIVDALNQIRPDLFQFPNTNISEGSIKIFHTNSWVGDRRQGSHWKGDLPLEEAHKSLLWVKKILNWNFSNQDSKILMLTHNQLAFEQHYSNIAKTFRYSESYIKKENPIIQFLVDIVEPVCEGYLEKTYGRMFSVPEFSSVSINSIRDKQGIMQKLDSLIQLRESGTIINVIEFLSSNNIIVVPDNVFEYLDAIKNPKFSDDETPRSIRESSELMKIQYKEIIALKSYIDERTPFSTKHGVKGLEYNNVFVILGRGWNHYNWNDFLELDAENIPQSRTTFYERNRNLFYVCCSRPKRNLALLFTQELSDKALQKLSDWFGESTISSVNFDEIS